MDSRYILKVELTRFDDNSEKKNGREGGVKSDPQVSGLSNWADGGCRP